MIAFLEHNPTISWGRSVFWKGNENAAYQIFMGCISQSKLPPSKIREKLGKKELNELEASKSMKTNKKWREKLIKYK